MIRRFSRSTKSPSTALNPFINTQNNASMLAMAAAALVASSAITPAPALAAETAADPLLSRYSKVKTGSQVEGAKAVLQRKVEAAKQEALNAPKAKAAAPSAGERPVEWL